MNDKIEHRGKEYASWKHEALELRDEVARLTEERDTAYKAGKNEALKENERLLKTVAELEKLLGDENFNKYKVVSELYHARADLALAREALEGLVPWVEWARSKLEDAARMNLHKCDKELYTEKVKQVDAALYAACLCGMSHERQRVRGVSGIHGA